MRLIGITLLVISSLCNNASAHTLAKQSGYQSFRHRIVAFFSSPTDEEIVRELKLYKKELTEKNHKNAYGVMLTEYEFPSEILDDVNSAFLLAKKSKTPAIQNSVLLRDILTDAIYLIARGRGASLDPTLNKPDQKTGWSLGNRDTSRTGINEIRQLLQAHALDQTGADLLIQTIQNLDLTSDSAKTDVGYPPQYDIGSDAQRNQILSLIQSHRIENQI